MNDVYVYCFTEGIAPDQNEYSCENCPFNGKCGSYRREMNEKLSHEFIEAIRTFAEKPDNIENFESYLGYHFEAWLEKFAHTSKESFESLVSEMKHFAEMEV